MGFDREKRGLFQRKMEKPQVKKHAPLKSEGTTGSFSIRNVAGGVFLFFKGIGEWFKLFNSRNHMLPEVDAVYDIGSENKRWRKLWVSEKSLHIGDVRVGSTGAGTSAQLTVQAKGTTTGEIKIGDLTLKQAGSGSGATLQVDNPGGTGEGADGNVTVSTSSTDSDMKILLADGTGSQSVLSDTNLLFNPSTDWLSAPKILANTYIWSEGYTRYKDITAPSTPESGYGVIYVNSDKLYFKNDAGTATDLTAGGGGVDAYGTPADNQIAVWTDVDTLEGTAKLTLTTNDGLLIDNDVTVTADSSAQLKITGTTEGYNSGTPANNTAFGALIAPAFNTNAATDSYVGLNVSTPNINVSGGALTNAYTVNIQGAPDEATNNYALNVGGFTVIDRNTSGDGAEDAVGLHVDFDRDVATSGTAAHNDIGIDLDVNSASEGTSTVKGMDIDVVGATSGTHTATGIDLDVDGADTNIGMLINTAGTHLKLVANADPSNDYATIDVANTGDLSIRTFGNGTTDSDISIRADGDITLSAAGGQINCLDTSGGFNFLSIDNANTRIDIYNNADDYIRLTAGAHGSLDITTIDAAATAAHFTVNADGNIVLDAATGTITLKDNGSTYTPSASSDATTKAYVDDAIYTGTAYSSTVIKVYPTAWRVNDDYARLPNLIEDDTTDTLGFRVANTNEEAYAFVPIPAGYSATHVQVHASASTSSQVQCLSFNYQTGATVDLETFALNANQDITDVDGDSLDLVIKYEGGSTLVIVYGATVTIAAN